MAEMGKGEEMLTENRERERERERDLCHLAGLFASFF